MKVGWVVPGGLDRSGTHRVIPCLLWLLGRLARDHEVHAVAMRGEEGPVTYPLLGASVRSLGGASGPRLRTPPAVRALVAEHRRAPFQVLHAFWATGPGVAAGLAGRALGVPVVLHLAGGDLTRLPDVGYGGRLTLRGRLAGRVALSLAGHLTAPSGPVQVQARALGYRTERLPLGVALDAWPPGPIRRREPTGPARLVHVGSLNPVKDQPTLLRAVARLRARGLDVTLDVAGDDTLGGSVQRLARELGLDGCVRFHGFLPHDRLVPLVAGAHLMVVSSRHEAGPVAVLEAAAAGVPTVGTDVGLVSDWSPRAALAVPVGDDEALAEAAGTLLADEDRRVRMAGAARTRALARDADWSARRVDEIYRALARHREPSHA